MTFNDVLSQTIAMLQQHGRVSYRALKEAAQSAGLAVINPEEQEQQTTAPGDRAQEEDEA